MLENSFEIGGFAIENHGAPYIIAEAGSNHNQDMDTARKLIDAAADAGVNAVKFQLFLADNLYPNRDGYYDVFKSIELNREWIADLAAHCKERGVDFMATPFDAEAVDLLVEAGVPAFKMASSEATNTPLMAKVAKTGLPVIISTGMCDLVDVSEAAAFCDKLGASKVALLQCGAVYPLPPEDVNLAVMDTFRSVFDCPVGYSDHTLGLGVPVAAVARGGCIIEKHFTLDRKSEGPDHFYALEPDELKSLVTMCREAHAAIGGARKTMLPQEREVGRREGLYAARDIAAGTELGAADIEIKRPAVGIRMRHLDRVTGARVQKGLSKGDPVNWTDLDFS